MFLTFYGDGYSYGFNGMEKDDEHTQGKYDFGARIYDSRLGRWLAIDPLAAKYPYISSYSFVLNTPISAVDPDGEDVYLVVWFSEDGETGHAGIAVDNYKSVEVKNDKGEVIGLEMVPDGTVTYFDLWPESPVGKTQLQTDVFPDYGTGKVLSKDELLNTDPSVSGEEGKVSEFGEGRSPDGVIQMKSGYVDDVLVRVEAKEKIKNNESYNACGNNCSTFSQDLLNVVSTINIDANQEIKPKRGLMLLGYSDANTVAPNNLYNTAASVPGAKVLKGPSNVEAKPYLEYFGKENRSSNSGGSDNSDDNNSDDTSKKLQNNNSSGNSGG